MAEDFRTAFDDGQPIQTIASVTNTAKEILLPPGAQQITVGSIDAALWLSFTGTEGGTLTGATSVWTVATNYFTMRVRPNVSTAYVSTQAAVTTTVTVILE